MEDLEVLKVQEVQLNDMGLVWNGLSKQAWDDAVTAMVERMRPLGTVGTRFVLAFGRNSLLDLVVREAAHRLGFVPVTMNWQADTPKIFEYKIQKTDATFVVLHESCPESIRNVVKAQQFEPSVLEVTESMLEGCESSPTVETIEHREPALTLFTSGTTGAPKGVELSGAAYDANLEIFLSFLDLKPDEPVRVVLVNPMHHANSSSMSSWAMKHPQAELFVCSHYGTQYWSALAQIADGYDGRIVAPLVARHFEYLENLLEDGRLELDEIHRAALARTEFLVGSAPVGPQTVTRFKTLTGRLPRVRFGSTELCLQALGIPGKLQESEVLSALEKGWNHRHEDEDLAGYYIGRPHEPLTQAQVVASVTRESADFMKAVEPGAPGMLVVKSGSKMSGYVNDLEATEAVTHEDWYLGLGDVVFALRSSVDDELDYYWVSRSAGLMIRGGANYSCVQLESELAHFASEHLGWPEGSFDLAVVGHKLGSEHEDACCVLLEFRDVDESKASAMAEQFKCESVSTVSKGARPDHVVLGKVPRNFKGAIVRPKVKEYFDGLA